MPKLRRAAALMLAAALGLSAAVPAYGTPREYSDFDDITSHVTLAVPQTLAIAAPAQDTATTSDGYYLTGTSDPNQPLYLNGAEVPDRGIYGSWGVYVPLYAGANPYTVKQGKATQTVVITKESTTSVAVTDVLSKLYPAFDSPYAAGQEVPFSCTAPSGAVVWAEFEGGRVELTQVAAAADGVPARFSGKATVSPVNTAQSIGKITYGMTYGGDTKTASSGGKLLVYPQGSVIAVQIIDSLTTVYKDSAAKTVSTVVKGGAVDTILEQTDEMLLLGMGGWVPKESVTLLLSGNAVSVLTGAAFSKTATGEQITLTGTGSPITDSWQTDKILHLELFHTGGTIPPFSLGESKLFSGIVVTTQGDSTVLELSLRPGAALWGHTIEYADGTITLACKYPPVSTGGADKPLAGIVVGLDGGHGGPDPGAYGTARLLGPAEKDINYATALAVQKRLESLGATVHLTDYAKESKTSTDGRTKAALEFRADFYISLHSNSVAGNGLKANGVEVYYYFTRAKSFADILQKNITAQTGRGNRGSKNNYFRVTMNSLTPAVLVEMGFLSNPVEYDQMCSRQGIFQVANAIGNSVVEAIS